MMGNTEACQHQQKKGTHLRDGLRGSSGGVQITSSTKYTTVGNQTIYAVWQIITYQITYNANGGSGAPGVQTKTHGQTIALNGTKPTYKYGTFLGWSTNKNASSATYAAGANYTANGNVTLYAIWQKYPDKVLYNNGTFSVGKLIHTSNNSISTSGSYIMFKCLGCNTLYFTEAISNKYRYLKVQATSVRTPTYGTWYQSKFFVSSNTERLSSSDNRPKSAITTQTIQTDNSTSDITSITEFTLDLLSVSNNSYYVGLWNCDTTFNVYKVWLTN